MAITTIFWDIGGVLERTEDRAPREKIARSLNWEVGELADLIFGNTDNHRIQLGQISLEEHTQNIAAGLGMDEDEVGAVIEAFFAGDRLDLSLVGAIREMKGDLTTAVISNYTPILRNKIVDWWGIGNAFDHLVISSEVGVMKPDPEIYRIALDRAGAQPEQSIFVDDFIENVQGAADLGIHGVHFQTPAQALAEIETIRNHKA